MDIFLIVLLIISIISIILSGKIYKHLNNMGYSPRYLKKYRCDRFFSGIFAIIFIFLLGCSSLCGFVQRSDFREYTNEYVPNIIKLNHYKAHCHQYKLKIRQAHQNLKHIHVLSFHNPKLSNMHLSTYNHYLNLRHIDEKKIDKIRHKYHNYQMIGNQGNYPEIKNLINRDKNSIFVKHTKLRKTQIHKINHKLNKMHYSKYDIKR